jgi:hypothetical protein
VTDPRWSTVGRIATALGEQIVPNPELSVTGRR